MYNYTACARLLRASIGVKETILTVAVAVLVACGGNSEGAWESRAAGGQAEFWAALQGICGGGFPGALIEGNGADSVFAGSELVMRVSECSDREVRISLDVGEDSSRTLILARTSSGLRLDHERRLQDGSENSPARYGGETREPGTGEWQEFHADAEATELFPEVAGGVWTVEIVPGDAYVYAMRQGDGDRRFRLQFDLTQWVGAGAR